MCGLIGVIGNIQEKEKQAFKNLASLNQLRGLDGCGFLILYEDGKTKKRYYSVIKDEEPSCKFALAPKFKKSILGKENPYIIMGHARHATVGKVDIENNHPFLTENHDLIGFHNGTIGGYFKGKSQYGTDSEALYNLIEQDGLKQALTEAYRTATTVAYALAYFDNPQNTVSLIRNDKRPLFIAKTGDAYFYASERDFLVLSLDDAGIIDYDISMVPENTLIRFFPDKEGKERVKYIPNYFKPPEPTTYSWQGRWRGTAANGNQGVSRFQNSQGSLFKGNAKNNGGSTANAGGNVEKKKEEDSKEVEDAGIGGILTFDRYKVGKLGYLNRNYVERSVKENGCCMCSSPISIDDLCNKEVYMDPIRNDIFFCEACNTNMQNASDKFTSRLIYPDVECH